MVLVCARKTIKKRFHGMYNWIWKNAWWRLNSNVISRATNGRHREILSVDKCWKLNGFYWLFRWKFSWKPDRVSLALRSPRRSKPPTRRLRKTFFSWLKNETDLSHSVMIQLSLCNDKWFVGRSAALFRTRTSPLFFRHLPRRRFLRKRFVRP